MEINYQKKEDVNAKIYLTDTYQKKPFQGWRYFKIEDSPKDKGKEKWACRSGTHALRARRADGDARCSGTSSCSRSRTRSAPTISPRRVKTH